MSFKALFFITDKETDETWHLIMYDFEKSILGWFGQPGSTVKKIVWGHLWATFEVHFLDYVLMGKEKIKNLKVFLGLKVSM